MKNSSKKLKPTLQVAHTECGLCCIRTILEAYGYQTTIAELRKIREPGRDGLGLNQIKETFKCFNIEAKNYKVKDNKALYVLDYPVIAYWKGCHYICVESFDDNEVVIMDPSIGRMKISKEEFLLNFSGYIIDAVPNKVFKKKHTSELSRCNKDYIWPKNMLGLYIKVAITSLSLIGFTLLVPILTQYIIDNGFGNTLNFFKMFLVLMLIAVVMVVISYLRSSFSIKMTYKFSWHLIKGAFTRVLLLPAKYFTVRAPGEIVYRLNALSRIQDILGIKLVQAILDMLSGIVLLIYVFYISPIMGIILIIFTIAILVFLSLIQPLVTSSTDIELHEASKAQSIELDAVVSINSVKLGGYVESYINDWKKSFKKMLKAMSKRMCIQQGIIGSILSSIQIFAPLMSLVVSLYFVERHIITIGQSVAIQTITSTLFSFANSVFLVISDSLVAVRYIELAEDIFAYPAEKCVDSERKINSGAISIKNMCFKYTPDSPLVISDISLDIKDGETIALVGLSGSGKTTLGKLISSLFEPSSGQIYFDGCEYNKWNLDLLRESISYIPQEAYLHNRTIIDNLKLGCNCTESEIISFCNSLPFLSFLQSFPMGYNTMISELGANLSGGQRQRIHVARVLLQKPKILVLDEATASLDNISQKQVYAQLEKLKCTKIVIAHRLATVLNADRIAVLDNGKIVQIGAHKELIMEDGPYSKLFDAELKRR